MKTLEYFDPNVKQAIIIFRVGRFDPWTDLHNVNVLFLPEPVTIKSLHVSDGGPRIVRHSLS